MFEKTPDAKVKKIFLEDAKFWRKAARRYAKKNLPEAQKKAHALAVKCLRMAYGTEEVNIVYPYRPPHIKYPTH